jgi:hypothetical protein
MNILLKENLEKISTKDVIPKILPHQLASVDFIFKKIYRHKDSVLLFHKMGSGKTIIALIIALLLTKEKLTVYIILLNSNIKLLWISVMNQVKSLMPYDEYNLHLLNIITKKQFSDIYESNEKNIKKIKSIFKNSIIMIDEAHNFFGNISSTNLIHLNSFFNKDPESKPVYLLITGTPITNTILTLKDLLSIMSKPVEKHEIIKQDGRKIYNLTLTKNGTEIIKNLLMDKISFYNKIDSKLPKIYYKGSTIINFPVIPCIMSEEQTKNYYQIKKNINNEMFLKYLKDASFTAMGNIENIYNFETYIKNKKYYTFTSTLYLNKGKFHGKELKTLDNSCKLKYFVEKKIKSLKNRCKIFIYFSNSRIGGRFLKDVLKEWGIQEYGQPQLDNFLCYYCNDKRTCKVCKPMKYIIITSIYLTQINNSEDILVNNINNLLDIYNLPNNDNGEEIIFLFGSKIISESYTLKETREIWFLTIPDSITEISQIIARCLRTFSYKDITIPVYIYILLSLTNDFKYNHSHKSLYRSKQTSNYDKINSFINNLNLTNNDYPYDFKKILYLEIKSKQTTEIYNIFKKCSPLYEEKIDPKLTELYILEILRRFAYENNKFIYEDFIKYISEDLLPTDSTVKSILNKFINDGVIIKNKNHNQSFIYMQDDQYICSTIMLKYKPYITKITL